MERLTKKFIQSNVDALLNFAYEKDNQVYLRYADGEEDISLCEYISRLANETGCDRTPQDIMNGECTECDCEVCVLNIVAIQAAELHTRLAELEDKLESGQLVELPCKVSDPIYIVFLDDDNEFKIDETPCIGFNIREDGVEIITRFCCYNPYRYGKFTDKSQAEARLKELQEQKNG